MKLKSKLLLALLATSSAAFAQTAPAAPEVTYNVGVVSQYRYRGIAQGKGMPALQGGIDYANSNGFYLGAWGSQIKWIEDTATTAKGKTELDLYGGYKFKDGGLDYDVGFLRYQYIANNTTPNANTNEVYGAVTSGVHTFKLSYALTTLFGVANTRGSDYIEWAANYDLGGGITLTPHLGRAIIPAAGYSYTDASATVAKDLGNGLTVTAAAIATTAKGTPYTGTVSHYQQGKSAVVLGLKYGF